MEAYVNVLEVIRLELTRREAEWLRSYVKHSPFEDESEDDQEIRENLFGSLDEVLR